MAAERRTWDLRHTYHETWIGVGSPPSWLQPGMEQRACGCLTDLMDGGRIWEPCMAHEGDGHLSVISEQQDGMFVARCLVIRCPWVVHHFSEVTATGAAQQHWIETAAGKAADGA